MRFLNQTLAFYILIFSGNLFAATDYTYCQKKFNSYVLPNNVNSIGTEGEIYTKGINSSYYPFELLSNGKIKPHPLFNYKLINGAEVLENITNGAKFKVVVQRNEFGEIVSVSNSFKNGGYLPYGPTGHKMVKTNNAFENNSTYKIEIKNGKCIPSRLDTVSKIGNMSRQDVIYDVSLCHDLSNFLKKNPDAATCFNRGYTGQILGIFTEYYKRNRDIYGPANIESLPWFKPEPLKTTVKNYTGHVGGMYGGYEGDYKVGMGFGADFTGKAQMLQPLGPSLDTSIVVQTTQGASPVASAVTISGYCNGGGYNTGNLMKEIVDDLTVWQNNGDSVPSVLINNNAIIK